VDLVFCATFPETEFQRERGVIASEILAAQDDPEEASHDSLLSRLWPGDPLALKIAGEVADIEAATRDALYDFYRRRITPEHLVISASGPFGGRRVADELERLLSAIPACARNEAYPIFSAPKFRPIRDFEACPISQVYLYETIQMDDAGEPDDYYALSILNGAFGESMSSRLFQDLREKRGLCYSVYSGFSLDGGLGLWLAQASSSPRLFPKLLEELDRQIDLVARGGEGALSEEEISESVSRIAGSFELALDDPEYRMKRLAKQKLCNGFALDAEETKAHILAVDKRRVDEMAERLFHKQPRARFAYGKRSAGVLRALEVSEVKAILAPGRGGGRG
jgi:predicted Zn-dependent peptidase